MSTRTLAVSTLVLWAGTLCAADKKLLSLVMPDVTVLAGVNVRGAAGSPLGRYVLAAMMQKSQQLQQASTDFGLDPHSFREVLVASNSAPRYDAGIAMVRGSFQPSAVIAKALDKGAVTETYNNVTLVTDAKHTMGLAFLGSNILVTGDVASVKTALDRVAAPWTMPAPLSARIAQLSAAQDAWMLSTVPASNLFPTSAVGAGAARGFSAGNFLQNVQKMSAGVKFGKLATVSALAQADTPETAQLLANTLKLMVNLLQAQSKQLAPESAQSLVVDPQGNILNLSFHVTDLEFRKIYQMVAGASKTDKKM
jgi:hypothetical protein